MKQAPIHTWASPENGAFKINVDTTMGTEHSFSTALARKMGGTFAEARKPLLAIWAEEERWNHVTIENDSQTVVHAVMLNHIKVPWAIWPIVHDHKHLLKKHPDWSIVHTYRDANVLAYELAK
ncbi:unnamed protein product [Ilex paraguariensis]|uniref:RNase H type-1 domain-containing protein n=1 Tax=Ilex paraguariensis TaxID=185542 RepID=A0ABC8V086_9AQUA